MGEKPQTKTACFTGARQVGKTTVVNIFSKRFDQYIYLNLELAEDKKVFEDFQSVERLIDDEILPEWAQAKFKKHAATLERSRNLFPNYWEADFSGEGTLDIAIFVKNRSSDKHGILFLLGEGDLTFLVGAGEPFDAAGDDFSWVFDWGLFNQKNTFETTFRDNGDIEGTREVVLERPAIQIKQDEGGSGLIYFDGEKFIWIHQGD